MKSRTSLFNPTAFKKDVTRFAPAWVLYTVSLFMMLSVCMIDNGPYSRSNNLANSLSFVAALNLCYGLLNGQLLFGDLFNARHCNALHAMPLTRSCWFFTHIVSGLLFALAPNLVMMLVAMPMLGGGWTVALWWLLAAMLQYLFFFGLAVFAALCVGNRFAMVLVYSIVNFFSLIVFWFYQSIYEPLLYGVRAGEKPFTRFCPAWTMMENYQLIDVARGDQTGSIFAKYEVAGVILSDGWGYLAICAGIGAALIGISLALYRRRKLESAGDFMAVRALEPVFLVLYTLCLAAFFQVFADLFGMEEFVFLALGLTVGFFTGRMLLMRTTRVFQPKSFLWFGILAAAFVVSMLLTWLDPIGVTRYIPDGDDVREAKISVSYSPEYGEEPYLSDPADIETIRQIHQLVLDGQIHTAEGSMDDYYTNLSVQYVMDYKTVTRKYEVACSSPAGQLAKTLYTRADFVLGTDDAEAFLNKIESVYFDDSNSAINSHTYISHTNRAYFKGLVEAILADCAEGTMAQTGGYHHGETVAWVEFGLRETEPSSTTYTAENGPAAEWFRYVHLSIYEDCRHTVAYLEENPFPAEEEVYG